MNSHARFRRRAAPFFRLLYRAISTVEFYGLTRALRTGPLLVVFNHLGQFDPPLVCAHWPIQPEIISAAEVFDVRLVGWVLKQYGAIPVRRGNFDRAVIEQSLAILRAAGVLAVAPEGRVSPTGALIEGRIGPAYLAMKAGAPLQPLAITGTEHAWEMLRQGRRPRLTMTVGEAFCLPELPRSGPDRKAALRDATDTIMRRIAALLPVSYRGAYG